MAQTGFTPIITYHSTTGSAVPLAADLAPGELALNIADMKLYCENSSGVVTLLAAASGASGDVVGPASATDNAIARFDLTTGKIIQNSSAQVDDSGNVLSGAGTVSAPAYSTTGDTNTGIFFPAADTIAFAEGGAEAMRIDSSGNVGIGTTSITSKLTVSGDVAATNVYVSNGADANAIVGNAARAYANFYQVGTSTGGYVSFHTTPTTSGSLAERMRITSAGEVLVGGTTEISSGSGIITLQRSGTPVVNLFRNDTTVTSGESLGSISYYGNDTTSNTPTQLAYINAVASGTHAAGDNPTDITFGTTPNGSATVAEVLRITSEGFTRPKAYADTVVALGNTGTATTITLTSGNVFTATLTGNCTFTLSNPIATGSSSFTLILTNDGTAGRTVAWSGGSFKFPGGAASLSRTTTANAIDIWVFFTPDGGTTWYGNIAMKNMAA